MNLLSAELAQKMVKISYFWYIGTEMHDAWNTDQTESRATKLLQSP